MDVKGNLNIDGVAIDSVGGHGSGSGSITFTDGTNSHTSTTLNFSDEDFYLSTNLSGQPVVNISRFRAALVTINQAKTIADATNTKISWDVEEYDIGAWWNSGDPLYLTVPARVSWVRVIGNIRWENDGNQQRKTHLIGRRRGGVDEFFAGLPQQQSHVSSGGSNDRARANFVSAPIPVEEGDQFFVQVFQATGGNLDIENTPSGNWFSIEALD